MPQLIKTARKVGERISTRYPTAKKAEENPLEENLIIGVDAMRAGDPKAFKKNVDLVRGYRSILTPKGIRGVDNQVDAVVKELTDNLLSVYEGVPEDIRNVSKEWYVGANRLANEIAEANDISTESASGVLAALSPQKDWYQNASLAERVASIHKLAQGNYNRADPEHIAKLKEIYSKPQYAEDVEAVSKLPYEKLTSEQKAMFVRSYDQAFNDRSYDIISPSGDRVGKATKKDGTLGTAAWGSNKEISKAIEVLEDPSIENISRQMGQMHKVRNFYNNIADPFSERGDVTIDTHAVAADLMEPLSGNSQQVLHNFGGTGSASSSMTGAQGTYGIHADAYREAARQAGIMPREMQSVTWEAIRGIFPAEFKGSKGNVSDIESVWNLYKKGDISRDHARALVLERAGGMDDPDWFVRPDSGVSVPAAGVGDEAGLYQSGVPGTGGVDARTRLMSAGMPAAWLGLEEEPPLTDSEQSAESFVDQGIDPRLVGFQQRRESKNPYWQALKAGVSIGDMVTRGLGSAAARFSGYLHDLPEQQFVPVAESIDQGAQIPEDNVYLQAIGAGMQQLEPIIDRAEKAFPESVPGQIYNSLDKRTQEMIKAGIDLIP